MIKSLYIAIFTIFSLYAATEMVPLDHRGVKNFRVMNAELIKAAKGGSQWDAVGIFQLCQEELRGENTGAICPQTDRIAFFGSLGIAVGLGIGFDQGVVSVPMTPSEADIFKGMAHNLGRNLRPESQFDVTSCANPTKVYEQQHLRGFTAEVNNGVTDPSAVVRQYTVDLFGLNEVKNDPEKASIAAEYNALLRLRNYIDPAYPTLLNKVKNSNRNYLQYDSPAIRAVFVKLLQGEIYEGNVDQLLPGYRAFVTSCAPNLQDGPDRYRFQRKILAHFIEAIRAYSIQFSLPVIEDVIIDERFKCVEVNVRGEISLPLLGKFLKVSIEAIQINPDRQRQIIKCLKLFVRDIVVTQRRKIGLFDLEALEERLRALLAEDEVPDPVAVRTAGYFDYEKDEHLLAKPVVFAIQDSLKRIQHELNDRIGAVKNALLYPNPGSANSVSGNTLKHFESISEENRGKVVSALRKSRLDQNKVLPFFKNYQARCIALYAPYFERLDALIAYLKTTPESTVEASVADDIGELVSWHSAPGPLRDAQHQALRDVVQLQGDVEEMARQYKFSFSADVRVLCSFLTAKPVYQSNFLYEYKPELLNLYTQYELGQNYVPVEEFLKGRDLNSMTIKQNLRELMAAEEEAAAERERQRLAEIERAAEELLAAQARELEEQQVREAERLRQAEIARAAQERLAAERERVEAERFRLQAGAIPRPPLVPRYVAPVVDDRPRPPLVPRYAAPVPVPVVPVVARLAAPELLEVIENRLKLIRAFRYYYAREASGYTAAEEIMTYGTSLPCRKPEITPMFKVTEVEMDGTVSAFDFGQFNDKPPFLEEWRDNMQAVLVKAFSEINIPISVAVDATNQQKLKDWFSEYGVSGGINYTVTQASSGGSEDIRIANQRLFNTMMMVRNLYQYYVIEERGGAITGGEKSTLDLIKENAAEFMRMHVGRCGTGARGRTFLLQHAMLAFFVKHNGPRVGGRGAE